MRSLNRPLEHQEVTRLYRTNFDVAYVNREMLEEMSGRSINFKTVNTRNLKLLRGTALLKTINIKSGSSVILLKNISKGLFNGMSGSVDQLSGINPPNINFNGTLVTLP